MLHNQTTPPAVIINTDIYTKYNTDIIPSSVPNNLNNSVIYPTMFDRWRDF
jgi:hypothetical protein